MIIIKKIFQKNDSPLRKILKVIFIAIVMLALVTYIVPAALPYLKWPYYTLKCGHPPIIATDFAAGYTYEVYGDHEYSVTPFTNAFFCTENEAQKAGYQRINL